MVTRHTHEIVRSFASTFNGTAIAPDSPDYDTARAVWNGSIDARPALIAQCRTADDIVTATILTRARVSHSRCAVAGIASPV